MAPVVCRKFEVCNRGHRVVHAPIRIFWSEVSSSQGNTTEFGFLQFVANALATSPSCLYGYAMLSYLENIYA